MEENKRNWGGKREGAGRPLTAGTPRKQRTLRASDEEWDIIREFSALLKKDKQKALEALSIIKKE